jgi:NADH:ubiquinone oxidoreductase subunit 3 (subunit A)
MLLAVQPSLVFAANSNVFIMQLGLFGFVEMMVFIVVLLVGFLYVWRKGALKWD